MFLVSFPTGTYCSLIPGLGSALVFGGCLCGLFFWIQGNAPVPCVSWGRLLVLQSWLQVLPKTQSFKRFFPVPMLGFPPHFAAHPARCFYRVPILSFADFSPVTCPLPVPFFCSSLLRTPFSLAPRILSRPKFSPNKRRPRGSCLLDPTFPLPLYPSILLHPAEVSS